MCGCVSRVKDQLLNPDTQSTHDISYFGEYDELVDLFLWQPNADKWSVGFFSDTNQHSYS